MKKTIRSGKCFQNMLRSSLHDAVALGIFLLIQTNCKSLTNHLYGRHFVSHFRFKCLSIHAVT